MFNLFRLCRKDEISLDILAVCDNKVECCIDKVERCFDIVAGVDGASTKCKKARPAVTPSSNSATIPSLQGDEDTPLGGRRQ